MESELPIIEVILTHACGGGVCKLRYDQQTTTNSLRELVFDKIGKNIKNFSDYVIAFQCAPSKTKRDMLDEKKELLRRRERELKSQVVFVQLLRDDVLVTNLRVEQLYLVSRSSANVFTILLKGQDYHMNIVITTPLCDWVKDESVSRCMLDKCQSKFGVTNRKHHCRICGIVCCQRCLLNKIAGVKACEICHRRFQTHKKVIS